jgi:hypothetical protein
MKPEIFNLPELEKIAGAIAWTGDGREVVYHGTRFGRTIMDADALVFGYQGLPMLSFTRSPHVAVYWALMDRPGDEGYGTVFTLDRKALEARVRRLAPPRASFRLFSKRGHVFDKSELHIETEDVTALGSLVLNHAEIRRSTIAVHDHLNQRWTNPKIKLSPGFTATVRAAALEHQQHMADLIEVGRPPWLPGKPTVTFTDPNATNYRLAALERLVGYLKASK